VLPGDGVCSAMLKREECLSMTSQKYKELKKEMTSLNAENSQSSIHGPDEVQRDVEEIELRI
jgi:hypothetical protein